MVDFQALVLASAVLIPLAIGLVQVFKDLVPERLVGLLAMVAGLALEFLAVGTVVESPSVGVTILLGIGVGLAASGAYSQVKKALQ